VGKSLNRGEGQQFTTRVNAPSCHSEWSLVTISTFTVFGVSFLVEARISPYWFLMVATVAHLDTTRLNEIA
jgi:hypothetical protein